MMRAAHTWLVGGCVFVAGSLVGATLSPAIQAEPKPNTPVARIDMRGCEAGEHQFSMHGWEGDYYRCNGEEYIISRREAK